VAASFRASDRLQLLDSRQSTPSTLEDLTDSITDRRDVVRLGDKTVASRPARDRFVGCERMGRDCDHDDVFGLGVGLEPPRGLPAVDHPLSTTS
jgi:hypothetical protein